MENIANLIDNMGLQNLRSEGFDALQFSLMGMGIVFGGLLFIALYIFTLPKLLAFFSSLKKKKVVEDEPQECPNELETLLAIACAFHMQKNFPEGNERITWKSHGEMESPWQVSGRMVSLGVRKRSNSWNKK